LETLAPFNLGATVRVLQRRPTNLVDVWEQEHYLRVLHTPEGPALVEVVNRGTVEAPQVRFRVREGPGGAGVRKQLEAALRRVLGLDLDPGRLQRVAGADARLRPTVLALRGMRPPRFPDFFEAFANVLPFQQLSLSSGVAITGRLVQRFGESLEHRGRRFHAFPTARSIALARPADLRACGLSARKAESLRFLARAIEEGSLREEALARMSTPDALRELVRLPGIGTWTAGVVLLRGLGRLDVFPPGDVGAIRGLATLMRMDSAAELERVIESLGDVRGYLYFCALGSSLLGRGLITPG
jgi:DNA-3-methyladenine glycosylase II